MTALINCFTCKSFIQLIVTNSSSAVVKLLQFSNAGCCIIGAWQIRLASVSLMPLGVGQVRFGCNGDVGAVALGGGAVSLAVITMFLCTRVKSKLQQHKPFAEYKISLNYKIFTFC